MMVDQLHHTRQIKHDLEKQLKLVGEKFPSYRCIIAIPGFGPIISAMIVAAISDAYRFTSRKQVLRLAGLDLSAARSGKTSNSAVPVISKQGKAALRCDLYQAALIASYKDETIRNYFTRLLKGREETTGDAGSL